MATKKLYYPRPFLGFHVKAEYHTETNPLFAFNPLIRALPPLRDLSEVNARMTRHPKKITLRPDVSVPERCLAIEVLNFLREPMSHHVDQYLRLFSQIRTGYVSRNPFEGETRRTINAAFEDMDWVGDGYDQAAIPDAHLGMGLFGLSGTGKTELFKSILGLIPQVIHHARYDGQPFVQPQIVWMILECPHKGSPRALCMQFFYVLDSILRQKKYYPMFRKPKLSTEDLLIEMANLAAEFSLGLLVIDEVQRLRYSSEETRRKQRLSAKYDDEDDLPANSHEILRFLVEMSNIMNIPFGIVGTKDALGLFSKDLAMLRRICGAGSLELGPLVHNGPNWNKFLKVLWTYQITLGTTPYTEEFSHALFVESQGIIDFCIRLYVFSQIDAVMRKQKKMTVSSIERMAKIFLAPARNDLQALKHGLHDQMFPKEKYFPPATLEVYQAMINPPIYLTEGEATLENLSHPGVVQSDKTSEQKISEMLIEANCPPGRALELAQNAIKRHAKEVDILPAIAEAFYLFQQDKEDSGNDNQVDEEKQIISSDKSECDLRHTVQKGSKKESNYTKLKKAGRIRTGNNPGRSNGNE